LASDSAKSWRANANLQSILRVNPQCRAAPSAWPFKLSLQASGYFCFRLILALELILTLALDLKIEFVAKSI